MTSTCRDVAGKVLVAVFTPVVFATLVMAAPSASELIAHTKSGDVRGVARAEGGADFVGIPFAQPPVGNLRWREPQPVAHWDGVRDATEFGAPCAQPHLGEWNDHAANRGKEDCLYLNVMTPAWPAKGKLPVMFWIHGGGNEGGTASSALYREGTLVQHGVILVTANYRLHVFGFFSHPALAQESPNHSSGNYGLQDQIAALRWVHDNIANFGGDPNNVTVFGQSAGGLDTSLMMVSPLAKGLFQKAIAESGTAFNPPTRAAADADKVGEKIADTLKAPAGDQTLAFLRGLSAEAVIKGIPPQNPVDPPQLGPSVDGWVIREAPGKTFVSGKQTAVPLLIGSTTREFSFDVPVSALRFLIRQAGGKFGDRAVEVYGLQNGGTGTTDAMYGPISNQWFADVLFRCPAVMEAGLQHAIGQPTYEYQFEHAVPGQEAQGAVHSSELPYVFGYYPQSGNLAGNFGDVDRKLANVMEAYWTNFAKTGNPNGAGVPAWPAFDANHSYLSFTQEGQAVAHHTGLRAPYCDLYRDAITERLKPANGK